MTQAAERTATKPRLTSAEPQLFVADIDTACDFFVQNSVSASFSNTAIRRPTGR